MEKQVKLSEWLGERCKREHLSLRQAAEKTSLSHATIGGIIKGVYPSPETIRKLAKAFGGDGKEGLALEDHLMTLAGYRTPRAEGEELSVAYATLIDKVSKFNDSQLSVMTRFANFLTEIEGEPGLGRKP